MTKILSKFGEQQLVMVNYACGFNQSETGKKLELLSAAPRATLTLLSCSPNFPRASITRYTHAKHEPILNNKFSNRVLPLIFISTILQSGNF